MEKILSFIRCHPQLVASDKVEFYFQNRTEFENQYRLLVLVDSLSLLNLYAIKFDSSIFYTLNYFYFILFYL